MDREDSYFSKFFPEFYKVYSCENEVSEKFKNNVEYYIKKYKQTNKTDKIFVLDSNEEIIPVDYEDCVHYGDRVAGMISIDNLDGTGHWLAFKGKLCPGELKLFDPMGEKSPYLTKAIFILGNKFRRQIAFSDITAVESRYPPQPRGGIIPDENKIMKWALENDKPLPPFERSVIMGYHAQHQFCYLEAFLWLVGRLRPSTVCNMTYPDRKLKWVKANSRFLDPPPEFLYVYSPGENRREQINFEPEHDNKIFSSLVSYGFEKDTKELWYSHEYKY